MQNDPVNHPSYYADGKYETIDFIEYYELGFHEGNAIKYLSRAGKKDNNDAIQDLKKALWYLKRQQEFDERIVRISKGEEKETPIHPMEYVLDKCVIPGTEGVILDILSVDRKDRAIEQLDRLIKCLECEEKGALE